MRDPYSVLGIPRSATEDEIKKAYRKLSRMYHPDTNINNPNKKQAEEKFKEVQEAYDRIMDERENGGGYSSYNSYNSYNSYGRNSGSRDEYGYRESSRSTNNSYGYGYGRTNGNASSARTDSPKIQAAISFISKRQFREALSILESISGAERNARWYYLRAHAYYGLGDIIQAKEDITFAVNMEPDNTVYREFYSQVNQNVSWYQSYSGPYSSNKRNKVCFTCGEIACIGLLCGCNGQRFCLRYFDLCL